jgi:hypothetical protein
MKSLTTQHPPSRHRSIAAIIFVVRFLLAFSCLLSPLYHPSLLYLHLLCSFLGLCPYDVLQKTVCKSTIWVFLFFECFESFLRPFCIAIPNLMFELDEHSCLEI